MFTLTWIQVKNTNHILSDVWSCKDPSFCIPLRIYGDGADAQQHFEIMTILPVLCCSSSTLDSRILCSVRNTSKTTNEARAHILQVLAWSFEALRVLDKWYYFLLFWFFQKKPSIHLIQPHLYQFPSAWSIPHGSGLGVHPLADPWGTPFSDHYNPDRYQRAGTRICGDYTACMDGIQGDADFVAAMFGLNSTMV